MTYDDSLVDVEFAADDGCPYAIHPVSPRKLPILRHRPGSGVA